MRNRSSVILNLPPRRRPRRIKGGLVVEMAICLPLLVWLTFAIIEYGIVLNTTITIAQLTRDTARYVAIKGGQANADKEAVGDSNSDPASIKNFLKTECASTSISYTDLKAGLIVGTYNTTTGVVTANTPTLRTKGSIVTVQLSYDMRKKISMNANFVPGLSVFMNASKPYVKRSSVIIENDPQ